VVSSGYTEALCGALSTYSATFTTTGVKATFPREVLTPGNQIRAVLIDGSELTVDLTPIVERLR
jgi:hypothetical protein